MKLTNLIELVYGELKNEPEISAIQSLSFYPSKIEYGDLFIGDDPQDIAQAIANGAYAILYSDENLTFDDNSIAHIYVNDLKMAAAKLLRYVIHKKQMSCYYFAPHSLSYAKQIITHKKNILFLSSQWRQAFEQLLHTPMPLAITDSREIRELLGNALKGLKEEVDGYVISDTLFRTTFRSNGYVYQEAELAPFHIDYLLRVAEFCKEHELPFEMEKLRYTSHFKPIYIDSQLRPLSQGKSEQVVIFVDNLNDITLGREYIKQEHGWIKTIVLTPPKTKVEGIDRPHWYSSDEEAQEILKNTLFNYAFIYQSDKKLLNQMKQNYSLFDEEL